MYGTLATDVIPCDIVLTVLQILQFEKHLPLLFTQPCFLSELTINQPRDLPRLDQVCEHQLL